MTRRECNIFNCVIFIVVSFIPWSSSETVLDVGYVLPIFDPTLEHIVIGDQMASMASLALSVINDNPSLLPGYTLRPRFNSSASDEQTAIFSTLRLLREGPVVGVIGEKTSGISTVVSHVCDAHGVPQIAPVASSTQLSEDQYELFLRMVPSDEYQGGALASLMDYFGWDAVTDIYVADNYGVSLRSSFRNFLGDNVDVPLEVVADESGEGYEDIVAQIADRGSNILTFFGSVELAGVLFRAALEGGILGEGFVWMGVDRWFIQHFFDTNPDLAMAMKGTLGVDFFVDSSVSDAAEKARALLYDERFPSFVPSQDVVSTAAWYTYDASFAVAMALQTVIAEGGDVYNGTAVYEAFLDVDFEGVSGHVRYQDDTERVGTYNVINWDGGKLNTIGTIEMTEGEDFVVTLNTSRVVWADGSSTPPSVVPVCDDDHYYQAETNSCEEGFLKPKNIYLALAFDFFSEDGSLKLSAWEAYEGALMMVHLINSVLREPNPPEVVGDVVDEEGFCTISLQNWDLVSGDPCGTLLVPIVYDLSWESPEVVAAEIARLEFGDEESAAVDDDREGVVAALVWTESLEKLRTLYDTLARAEIVSISPLTSSPEFTAGYPYFMRSTYSDALIGDVISTLLLEYDWWRIGVVYDGDTLYYRLLAESFVQSMKDASIKTVEIVAGDRGVEGVIQDIRDCGTQIVLLLFSHTLQLLQHARAADLLSTHTFLVDTSVVAHEESLADVLIGTFTVRDYPEKTDLFRYVETLWDDRPRYCGGVVAPAPTASGSLATDPTTIDPSASFPKTIDPTPSDPIAGQCVCRNDTDGLGHSVWAWPRNLTGSDAYSGIYSDTYSDTYSNTYSDTYCVGSYPREKGFAGVETLYAMDAVLAVSRGLSSTFEATSGLLIRSKFRDQMTRVGIPDSITGDLDLDDKGDRTLVQMQVLNHNGTAYEPIAMYDGVLHPDCNGALESCTTFAAGEKPTWGCVETSKFLDPVSWHCVPCDSGLFAVSPEQQVCTTCGDETCPETTEENSVGVKPYLLVGPLVVLGFLFSAAKRVMMTKQYRNRVILNILTSESRTATWALVSELSDTSTDILMCVVVCVSENMKAYVPYYAAATTLALCTATYGLRTRVTALYSIWHRNRAIATETSAKKSITWVETVWHERIQRMLTSAKIEVLVALFEDIPMATLNVWLFLDDPASSNTKDREFVVLVLSLLIGAGMCGFRLQGIDKMKTMLHIEEVGLLVAERHRKDSGLELVGGRETIRPAAVVDEEAGSEVHPDSWEFSPGKTIQEVGKARQAGKTMQKTGRGRGVHAGHGKQQQDTTKGDHEYTNYYDGFMAGGSMW